MARIAAPRNPGPLTRLAWRIGGRELGGKVPEPVKLMAHSPLIMHGYGGLELAFERTKRAPARLKALAECKAAALAGCEWCMDIGSWIATHRAEIPDEQLRELPRFRESDAFDDDERLVLEYAEAITRTPVEVPDELFEKLRERFDEAQIVELTFAAAIENLRARFNWALGISSQGYAEGAVCIQPEALPEVAAQNPSGEASGVTRGGDR
jgi:alkylhydroperoxidase family enzyme